MAFLFSAIIFILALSSVYLFIYQKLKADRKLTETENRLLRLEMGLELSCTEDGLNGSELIEYYEDLSSGLKKNFEISESGIMLFNSKDPSWEDLSFIPSSSGIPAIPPSGKGTLASMCTTGKLVYLAPEKGFNLYFSSSDCWKYSFRCPFFFVFRKDLQ